MAQAGHSEPISTVSDATLKGAVSFHPKIGSVRSTGNL
jgi:hypothetical protein